MKVYEDFARVPGVIGMQVPVVVEGAAEQPTAAVSATSGGLATNPIQQVVDKLTALLEELDACVKRNVADSLTTLPPDHEIIAIVRQINVAASQFFVRDELALWFSQKLVNLLYKTEVTIGIEIYIILLERICEISKRIAKELTIWLLFSDDEV